jgi:hypothetical protein
MSQHGIGLESADKNTASVLQLIPFLREYDVDSFRRPFNDELWHFPNSDVLTIPPKLRYATVTSKVNVLQHDGNN